MTIIIICIAALLVLGVIVALFSRKDDHDTVVVSSGNCSTCNGRDDKCEQTCMMEAALREPEYYDDEELDAFAGRESCSYTDSEAEQFREVLYTMRAEDVKGWNRSLVLRGISVPNQLKDELIMLLKE